MRARQLRNFFSEIRAVIGSPRSVRINSLSPTTSSVPAPKQSSLQHTPPVFNSTQRKKDNLYQVLCVLAFVIMGTAQRDFLEDNLAIRSWSERSPAWQSAR